MRVEVRKFLLFGPQSQKKEFFKRAQKIGAIEFIDHSGQKLDVIPEDVKSMNQALKILRRVPPQRQHSFENIQEARNVSREIVRRFEQMGQLYEEMKFVRQEMSRVAVFGNFSKEDLQFIQEKGNRKVQFFFAKDRGRIPESNELIYIGKDHDLYYFISINQEEKEYEGMIEMKVEKPYGEYFQRKKDILLEIKQIEYRLKELAAYQSLIKQAVVQELNNFSLKMNQSFVDYHWEESFFSVEVWVAKPKIEDVEIILDSFSVYMTEIEIDDKETVPTYLENHGFAKIGEDLVYIYDTPSNEDKDPSNWVLWSFALFFAFIIGDGGYGFIFLALVALIHWKVKNPSPFLKRFKKLVGILAVSCIVWGFAITSFFGIDFSLENNIKRYSPLTVAVEKKASYHMKNDDEVYQEWVGKFPELKNVRMPYELLTQAVVEKDGKQVNIIYEQFVDNFMLELALFIGVIHLISSMVRNLKRHWAGLGWICFLIGGYLYFPKYLNVSSLIHYVMGINPVIGAMIGAKVLLIGVALSVILALIQHKMGGAQEIMNIIQVFADVLSYLRLYALALAGSIMANTFNGLGLKVNIFFGVLIILAGHLLNIALSIMSGVIHGLRLNFLEWYHFCFDGGGKRHKPLALLEFRK